MTKSQSFILLGRICRQFIAHALVLVCIPAFATTFITTNTVISPSNTNYQGADIVVSNCTLTVDGPHNFNSLEVATGGVLTHSSSSNGIITDYLDVTNEEQTLSGTNAVILDESNIVMASITVSDSTGTNFYTNGQDYLLTVDGIFTELQRTTNSTILDGETVLVNYQSVLATAAAGLNLSISSNVMVDVGGAIIADGEGLPGGSGAGPGGSAGSPRDGAGGGYGGYGGMSSSNGFGGIAYGSYSQPSNLGSGGGSGDLGAGGSGGGLVEITAGGNVTINGLISANGANAMNSRSGGGSGGSIWITGLAFFGSGTITANGGSGEPPHGGGGGGGRIALQSTANQSASPFGGSMTAYGGMGAMVGGAGTIYTQSAFPSNESLLLDNGGQLGTNTPVSISDSGINALVQGNAKVVPTGAWNVKTLVVASNGFLLASPTTTLTIFAAGSVTIAAGGKVLADSAGSPPNSGSGSGRYTPGLTPWPCGGGGYGGGGGSSAGTNNNGGITYGSQILPSGYGSGGGMYSPYSIGGFGGGGIQITVLNGVLRVDGQISANGSNGSGSAGGGGSGGTISLTGGTLIGTGILSANGGTGANSIGGGGGGGRIYINQSTNIFTGVVSTYGGGGGNFGGAGTVYYQVSGQNAQLVADNGGHAGTNTLVTGAGTTDLIVRNGAIVSSASVASFANLSMSENAWLAPYYLASPPSGGVNFSLSGNATIPAGCGIIADFAGYGTQAGPGAGRNYILGSTNFGSGASHGGYGGTSMGNYVISGTPYDNANAPTQLGSGGGGSLTGGSGGGLVRLAVTGTLTMNGIISANGGNGTGLAGGGGSGGSIWISANIIAGNGLVSANGGNGATPVGGGGGGGGMIFAQCNNNLFQGAMTAYGGNGANRGGAGTVLTQLTGKNYQLVLDGGGNLEGYTGVPSLSSMDVTVRNGAVAFGNINSTLGNVLISSNAWLVTSNNPTYVSTLNATSLTIQSGGGIQSYNTLNISCSTLTIQAGGSIVSVLLPSGVLYGSGGGHSDAIAPYYPCSGGGHGGLGGSSYGNLASGGGSYDTPNSPLYPGSNGGYYSPYSVGGEGGGLFTITVTGLMQLDGAISVNGGNGGGLGGGGGSGGSIKLTAGTLAGSGTISANGGNGVGVIGGGGGGGCIAIFPTGNLFTGTIQAYGGGGANWGGAGTIYLQPTIQTAQLILDNNGNPGAGTPIPPASTESVTIRNGASGFPTTPSETLANLLISSNAWLTANPIPGNNLPGTVNFTVTGNATIQAGGGIVADAAGSTGNSGTGAGHSSSANSFDPCSGGGYGGYGANSSSNFAQGGTVYGSVTSPTVNGSGGGGITPNSIGGSGGGAIHLTITGVLEVSGKISAIGGNGSGLGGGGGSGGSILLTVGTLAGSGIISANGGSGADSIGGGGGGGRISIGYTAKNFSGNTTAYGGGGANWGGAGTIYTKNNSQPAGQVLVDNGGMFGTNTPLSSAVGLPSAPFDLAVADGGIVTVPSNFPVLNDLTVGPGGLLTSSSSLTSLNLLVLTNVTIATNGEMAVDGQGYGQGNGPGAGQSADGYGSGAGYGGIGGASGAIPGGISYGSAIQPVDFGSGGGAGGQGQTGGQGGGAILLDVGGTLTLNGQISAAGEPGLEDNSGGGSGGSIWVNAGALTGTGLVAANGGEGELYGGGGGAGGRIALYASDNLFLGAISAIGGAGETPGANGSIVNSNNILPMQVLSNSPSGLVSNAVSSVTLYFSDLPNPNSITTGTISLLSPNGPLSGLSISMLTLSNYLVSFPQQTEIGNYTLTASTGVKDWYGQPLAPAYTNTFTIVLPVIQGTVTDTNGNPIPGVTLQPTGGFSTTTTDTNGNYALGFTPGATFTVTPSQGSLLFVPALLSYTNVSASVSNQNYLAVTSIAPALAAVGNSASSSNITLGWQGIAGVNYQVYSSTDCINWTPYGNAFTGSNGPVQVVVPTGTNGAQFFSVQSSNN